MGKLNTAPTAYAFDDFLLMPSHSKIKSRKDPDISIDIPGFKYRIPIVSSPMNTISEKEMVITMYNLGGVGVIHRYMSIEEQVNMCRAVSVRLSDAISGYLRLSDAGSVNGSSEPGSVNGSSEPGSIMNGTSDPDSVNGSLDPDPVTPLFYAAIGANGDSNERLDILLGAGVQGICVDVANGHNELCIRAVEDIGRRNSKVRIMAGNVCTYEGARDLAAAGAHSIRIGVGPGSLCTTRLITGHGVPQLSAIENCLKIKLDYPDVALIADGGIRTSGDVVKALAIGADCVMLGSLLAGTTESPGEWLEEDGRLFKYYHGMASEAGRKKWFDKSKAGLPNEGVSTKVPYLGKSASKIIEGLCQSVKVGLSYSGARNIEELRANAKWCRVTAAGYIEGTPHGKR